MKIKATSVWAAAGLSVAATSGLQADQANLAPADRSYTGTVMSVNPQEHILSTRELLISRQFNLGDNCAYVLPDNLPGAVTDLRPGERVRVMYQESQGVRAADRVEVVPMHYEGMVKSIDSVNHTLTIRADGFDRDLQIANGCRVVLRNNQSGTLGNIQPGDHVTVIYETPGDQKTAWQIAQTSESFTGSLVAFDLTDRTLKARAGFGTREFTLGDKCAIVMNGKPGARLDDLKPDERLVFNYDEVNGVNVVNRIAPAPEPDQNPSVSSTPPGMGY